MKTKFIFFLTLLFIIGSLGFLFLNNFNKPVFKQTASQENKSNSSIILPERVLLTTVDRVAIVGDWYQPVNSNKQAIILLHMMNRDRRSWTKFAQVLSQANYSVLAIDLRGHGESTIQKLAGKNIKLDYRQFTDKEHQASSNDILAALDFIVDKKQIEQKNIKLIGASIGANLALQVLQSSPQLKLAVLLSPGLDYRGIDAEFLVKQLASDQRILMIASQADKYSANSVQELSQIKPELIDTQLFAEPQASHGTDMFKTESNLNNIILKWLTDNS